jgi:hypothetical protein
MSIQFVVERGPFWNRRSDRRDDDTGKETRGDEQQKETERDFELALR